MISRTYDIMGLWYHIKYHGYYVWYHVWYYPWYHCPACMISRTYDIIGQWYQSTYHKFSCMISEMISSMISNMISSCLYPPLKTRCIERCRSRALQVQVQDVQNRWLRSSALLDKARPVLGVRRIQTGNARHSVSKSVIVLGRWTPHQARPVFLVVLQSQHRWTRLRCSAGAGLFFWMLNTVTPSARIHVSDGHSNWI